MSIDVEKLNVVIEGSADNATASVDRLIDSVKELKAQGVNFSATSRSMAAAARQVGKDAESAADGLNGEATAAQRVAKGGKSASTALGGMSDSNKKATETLKKFNNHATHTQTKLGNLLNSIKRIAFYRAIRAAIRELTQAFSEGIQYFVAWDRNYNNGMAGAVQTTEELKNKWDEVKAATGASVMPIIQAVKPALDWLMNTTINFLNYIQQVVRALRGEEKWYRAIYKDAEATTGAAKELRRTLFGFDELNILPSSSGSSSSSELGGWIYELEDIPDKAQLAETAIKGLTSVLLGVGLLSGLKGLINLFNRKNQSLDTQAQRATADAYATQGLSTAFNAALLAGGAFASWLSKEKLQINIQKPELDFTDYKEAISEMAQYAAESGIVIKTAADTTGYQNIIQTHIATQGALNIAPLTISTTMSMSGAANALASGMSSLQSQLNNNPLYIPTVVQGQTSGYGSTYRSYSVADSMWADATALVNLQNQLAAAEASRNLTATDYINYAESTGLNLSAQDKQALAAAVAGVVAAPIASWLAGGSVLSTILAPILGFAGGGDPIKGSLFYAGENGAEVVASSPSGTGVMNMQQMQAAVSNGNVEVVSAIGVMANMIASAINNKSLDLYIGDEAVGRAATRYMNGQSRATGIPVLAR